MHVRVLPQSQWSKPGEYVWINHTNPLIIIQSFNHNQQSQTNETRCLALQWRHNGRDGVSNHQPHHCLLNSLSGRRSKKTSKFRITGLCAGHSPVTGEFPTQMVSNAENFSIWWRHHGEWQHPRLAHISTHKSWPSGNVGPQTKCKPIM